MKKLLRFVCLMVFLLINLNFYLTQYKIFDCMTLILCCIGKIKQYTDN